MTNLHLHVLSPMLTHGYMQRADGCVFHIQIQHMYSHTCPYIAISGTYKAKIVAVSQFA